LLGTDSRRGLRAGHEGRGTTIQVRSQRDAHRVPGTPVLEGTVISARQWRALLRQRRVVWLVVGLVAAAQVLRSSRLDRDLIVGAIVLRALGEMGRKELVRTITWLNAWQNSRLAEWKKEHRPSRQATAGQPGPAATDMPGEAAPAGSG
jgi:hypothetical protein